METIEITIAVIVGVFAIIAYTKGFFSWLWGYIKSIAKHDSSIKVPNKTLSIVVRGTGHECMWHMGSVNGDPAMQIHAHFTATNISKLGVLVTSAQMRKPKCLGHIMAKQHDGNIYGGYIIPSGAITEISMDFWITPPIKQEGEPFVADVAAIDQFGNQHWVKNVEFAYH